MQCNAVGGLDSSIEATRELKNALEIDVCVEIVRDALREVGLGPNMNVSNPSFVCQEYEREVGICYSAQTLDIK
jgi:hypothetical protein